MSIHLPTHLRTFVERGVASGRYETEDQVIEAALERLAEEPPFLTLTVGQAVAEAQAEVDRGDVRAFTDDYLERSAERAIANQRRGHRVSEDVVY